MHLLISIPLALIALFLLVVCAVDFHREGMRRVRGMRPVRKSARSTTPDRASWWDA